MEPASPQGSRAKEGGGIKGRRGLFESEKPWCRRIFGDFLAVQKDVIRFVKRQKDNNPTISHKMEAYANKPYLYLLHL